MKRNYLKQATALAFAAAMVITLPTTAEARTDRNYETPMEYSIRFIKSYDDLKYTADYKTDVNNYYREATWYNCIFTTVKYNDIYDKINLFKTTFPEFNNLSDEETVDKISEHTSKPLSRYYRKQKTPYRDLFKQADPNKQYFPTIEFQVGSTTCYVDGKPFVMEDAPYISDLGKLMVPMGYLSQILSNGGPQPEIFMYGPELRDTHSSNLKIISPIAINRGLAVTLFDEIDEGYTLDSHYTTDLPCKVPMSTDHLAYGSEVKNNNIFIPAKFLASVTNTQELEWHPDKQVAVIPGQYSPEALPYAIFEQPGTKSQYDLFKDWEMQPNQPVRYLTK